MSSFLDKIGQQQKQMAAKSGPLPKAPPAGTHTFRILPGQFGKDKMAWIAAASHWVPTGVDETGKEVKVQHPCRATYLNENCPVCNAVWQLKRTPGLDKATEQALYESRAQVGYVMNVLHRTSDEPNKPILLRLTPKTMDELFNLFKNYAAMLDADEQASFDPTDLQNGMDIVIIREGTGRTNTKYQVMLPPRSKPVDPSVMENIIDLDAWVDVELTKDAEHEALEGVRAIAGLPSSATRPVIAHQPRTVAPALAATVAPIAAAQAVAEDAVFTPEELAQSAPEPAPVENFAAAAQQTVVETAPPVTEVKVAAAPAQQGEVDDGELDALIAGLG